MVLVVVGGSNPAKRRDVVEIELPPKSRAVVIPIVGVVGIVGTVGVNNPRVVSVGLTGNVGVTVGVKVGKKNDVKVGRVVVVVGSKPNEASNKVEEETEPPKAVNTAAVR